MKIRMIAVAAAATFSVGLASSALAQMKPDVMVKQRQAAMTLLGKYFGPVAGMASGSWACRTRSTAVIFPLPRTRPSRYALSMLP